MTVTIEQHRINTTPQAILDEVARSKMKIETLVVGYVLEDGSIKLQSMFDSDEHLIAIHGALRELIRERAQ